jgi:hypothetical protein
MRWSFVAADEPLVFSFCMVDPDVARVKRRAGRRPHGGSGCFETAFS